MVDVSIEIVKPKKVLTIKEVKEKVQRVLPGNLIAELYSCVDAPWIVIHPKEGHFLRKYTPFGWRDKWHGIMTIEREVAGLHGWKWEIKVYNDKYKELAETIQKMLREENAQDK